jgi:hypothetical protein
VQAVLVIVGVWLALAGAVAALAGVTAAGRRRKLRGSGKTAWATVVRTPSDSDEPRGRSAPPVSLQFALEDGRIIERPYSPPAARRSALYSGQKVLIWYDPVDPAEVLVFGQTSRRADVVFTVIGLLFIAIGASLAALGG